MKKKRCLIFGSNGFIAQSFSNNHNLKKKFDIIKFPKQKINLLKDSCLNKLDSTIKNGDYILFLAGEVPCRNLSQLENNVKMITNFLKIVQKKKISYLSYVSSDAVYEDTKKKINEKSNVAANSFHGTMHLIRENLIRKIYKGKLSIFRPTLIFGSKDPHNGYGPNQFIRLALKKKKLVLFGKGEEKRDHIHIETVIKILSHAFFKKKIGTYNIASGKIFSFFLIAKKIEKVILRKKIIIFKKRNGPLHHLGLRQFNVTKIKKNFKDIKLINIFDFLDYFDLKEYKK